MLCGRSVRKVKMGFGYLLYGYLMLIDYGVKTSTANSTGFDIFPDLLGYILFFVALNNLAKHAAGFARAKSACIPLFVVGGITLVGQLLTLVGVQYEPVKIILDYAYYAKYPLLLFFHIGMLDGIRTLSLDVDLPKLSDKARIGTMLSAFYYSLGTCMIFFEILVPNPPQKIASIYATVGYMFQILFYLMFFYVLYVIFSSYRQICYEGDENMDTSASNPLTKLFEKYKNAKNRHDN